MKKRQFQKFEASHYNPRTKGFQGLCSRPADICASENKDPAEWEYMIANQKTYISLCDACKRKIEAKQEKPLIKAGTLVVWSSQAGGCATEKEGVVLGFIPGGKSVYDVFSEIIDKAKYSSLARLDPYLRSRRDRYFVEVNNGKPTYYAPVRKWVNPKEKQLDAIHDLKL